MKAKLASICILSGVLIAPSATFAAPAKAKNAVQSKSADAGAKRADAPDMEKTETAGSGEASISSPLGDDFGKAPTYIKSDTLTLKANERLFTYSGNVEVKQGDMTLTSEELQGRYDENNKIQELVALNRVTIVKGDNIKANGERAVYTAKTGTVVLTENPELEQEGSVLTADVIRIFLEENRSTAEGDVRVKLLRKDGGDNPFDLKNKR